MDLTESGWETRVAAWPCFEPEASTLFIAEGLLMYLTEARVAAVFRFVRETGTEERRFAFTFMETQPGRRVDFANARLAARLWLRLRGEPFRWGIDRERLPSFLASHGFRLRELVTAETFRERYLNGTEVPLAEGECVCVAEVQ